MGDLYKEAGGWKGIRKDILEPLAEYQKSLGMNTSFTRLYDAYNKIQGIQKKREEAEKNAKKLPVIGGGGTGQNLTGVSTGTAAATGGKASGGTDRSYSFNPQQYNYGVNDYHYYLGRLGGYDVLNRGQGLYGLQPWYSDKALPYQTRKW
ncbi:hypothetical protein [Anaeroselena agilis]|uniref:Uncharacterized protein n=1 Tax=Anaeroselena agilis TaxID=3063788 RepID=A0ABU3NVK1_9FIRM|nr:hypothetical protein [Selenomonadales bacterium 4137-cl]